MLAIVTVNTDQDVVDENDQLTSLREAIEFTNNFRGPDEIIFDFDHDDPVTIKLNRRELKITDPVTITGPGPDLLTIDARTKSRIFNISEEAGDVLLAGLTMTRGRWAEEQGHGGAVLSTTAGELAIRDSVVSNSLVGRLGHGAAIHATGDLTIQSSSITENGGSGRYGLPWLRLSSSRENRSALAASNVNVIDSTISDNGGTGIYASGNVTIDSSTISRNLGCENFFGAGGVIAEGNVAVRSSTISDNTCLGIHASGNAWIHSSTIARNTDNGIRANGDLSINLSTVSENGRVGVDHTKMFYFGTYGDLRRPTGNLTIVDSTIANNLNGGVVSFGDVSLLNTIVAANGGKDLEFAHVFNTRWSIDHSLIGHNYGSPLAEAPLGSPDGYGNLIGGPASGKIDPRLEPLAINGGPTSTHALLADSPAIDSGDPSAVHSIGLPGPNSDQRGEGYLRVDSGRIDIGAHEHQNLVANVGNVASPTAQAVDSVIIAFSQPVTNFDISDLRLTRNDEEISFAGDELFTSSDKQMFVVSGLTKLTDVPGYYTLTVVAGPGIQAADGTLLDANDSVSWAMGRTEPGLIVDTLVDEEDGRIDDGDISLRDALAFAAPGETISFAPSLDGGTLRLTLGQVSVSRSVTVDAKMLPAGIVLDGSGSNGAPRMFFIDDGDAFVDSPVTLRGMTLTGFHPAAVFSREPLFVDASTIIGNVGGGIVAEKSLTVTFSTITENDGSGIRMTCRDGRCPVGDATIISSTVSKNTARFGGGIHSGGNVTIESSTISGNSATAEWLGTGGGILVAGNLTINSSTISGNSATRSGGGISHNRGALRINSSTITGNKSPQGGGILAVGEVISINNSIVAANRGQYPDLHVEKEARVEEWGLPLATVECCERTLTIVQNSLIGDVRNTGLAETGVSTSDADGNLLGGPRGGPMDPRLGPLADNGGSTFTHALLPDSPAINMGDPSLVGGPDDEPTYDQRGVPYSRVVAGRIDMGAHERGVAGDANGDGKVDFTDFLVLSTNFGTGHRWSEGNFDGSEDGTQFADFLVLAHNFGYGDPNASRAAAASAVAYDHDVGHEGHEIQHHRVKALNELLANDMHDWMSQ